jgi:hypothetical protein
MVAPKKTKMGVNKWDEELARQAQMAASIEESVIVGGNFVSTRGGRLSFNGGEVPGNKLNVIILDHILENHYYTGRFDPDTPQSPVCFAFGRTEVEMAPHEKATEPQAEACKGCPLNEFGSADTGKGKACKNIRRLALIPEDAIEDLEGVQVAYFKVPVTSVKAWAGYIQQLANVLRRPPFAVVTEISIVPDAKTQFKVQFKLVSQIDDGDHLAALLAKKNEMAETIAFPYAPPSEEEEKVPFRGGKSVKGHPAPQPKNAKFARGRK